MSKLNFQEPINLITHDGKFHADEIFTTALLLLIKENEDCIMKGSIHRGAYLRREDFEWLVNHVKSMPISYSITGMQRSLQSHGIARILRTRIVTPEMRAIPNSIVYDIGYGEYDHHQVNSEIRENGVPYAAFGLVYREYGRMLFPNSREYDKFETIVVQTIDETDCSGSPNFMSSYVGSFMPLWDEENDMNIICERFRQALLFALQYIDNYARKSYSNIRAAVACESGTTYDIKIGRVLVLDRYALFNTWALENGVFAAIYPSLRGGWNCCVVNSEQGKNLCKFPKEWWGLRDEELASLSGIKTLSFCHRDGFIIATDTEDDALRAANMLELVTYPKEE